MNLRCGMRSPDRRLGSARSAPWGYSSRDVMHALSQFFQTLHATLTTHRRPSNCYGNSLNRIRIHISVIGPPRQNRR